MIIIVSILISVGIIGFLVMQLPQFGKAPSGERLERIKKSPNYKNGKFQNRFPTPMLPEGYTMAGEIYRTFVKKTPRKYPSERIPSVKTNLKTLSADENVLIWFGHSSYFMQIEGKKFLIDPVFSGSASPFSFGAKAFDGTDIYTAEDMPEIDYLLITHDHYDHLDYKTIKELQPKIQHIICGLGVGEHFEYWGFSAEKIIEKDWDESHFIDGKLKIHTTTAKHGAGRKLNSDNTLWLSFVIETPTHRFFLGGDSGYDIHFKEIGEKFGGFDLAILDNGQYGELGFATIHLSPSFTLQAYKDLNAKRLLPVHWAKFVLSRHPWDEPMTAISALSQSENIPLLTPKIGEKVYLYNENQTFSNWWENIN